jgi:hypothetical protein
MAEIAFAAFGRFLPPSHAGRPAVYDVRSQHAGIAGGEGGYWFDRATVLTGIADFVRESTTA